MTARDRRIRRRMPTTYAVLAALAFAPATIALWFELGVWSVLNAVAFVLIASAFITALAALEQEREERAQAEKQRDEARAEIVARDRQTTLDQWPLRTPIIGRHAG